VNEQLGSIFQALDMTDENGLTSAESESMTTFQSDFFIQVKEKLKLDAVFFLRDSNNAPGIPLIYFRAMDTYDSETIAELHR